MKIRSPLVTVGAVAAAGVAIWLVNGSHEPGATVTPSPAVASATVVAAAPPAPSAPPRRADPRPVRYVAEIPTRASTLTLDITVEGDRARAYACDNAGIEVWLRGRAVDGFVNLANVDGTSRLDGQLTPTGVSGTLSVDAKQWRFDARPVAGSDA